MLTAYPWTVALTSDGDIGILAASRLQTFAMPEHLLFPTFSVVVKSVVAGAVQVSLRFGFTDADLNAGNAVQGIDFPPLVAIGSFTQNAAWAPVIALPGFPGSAPGILPPRVNVLVTTDPGTGFNGIFSVYYCGILVP
jgi:hypothetical protein